MSWSKRFRKSLNANDLWKRIAIEIVAKLAVCFKFEDSHIETHDNNCLLSHLKSLYVGYLDELN